MLGLDVQKVQRLLGSAEKDLVEADTDVGVEVVVVDVEQEVGEEYSRNCADGADHHHDRQAVTDQLVAPEQADIDDHDEAVAEELFHHRTEQSWGGGTDGENIEASNGGGREEEAPGDDTQFVSWGERDQRDQRDIFYVRYQTHQSG